MSRAIASASRSIASPGWDTVSGPLSGAPRCCTVWAASCAISSVPAELPGLYSPLREEDVVADGERPRRHGAGERRCLGARVDADVLHRLAEGAFEVGPHTGVEPPSTAPRRCDRRLDVGMHEAARQDPLAILHPGDQLGEVPVPDLARGALEPSAAVVNALARHNFRRGDRARPLDILLELRIHRASIRRARLPSKSGNRMYLGPRWALCREPHNRSERGGHRGRAGVSTDESPTPDAAGEACVRLPGRVRAARSGRRVGHDVLVHRQRADVHGARGRDRDSRRGGRWVGAQPHVDGRPGRHGDRESAGYGRTEAVRRGRR